MEQYDAQQIAQLSTKVAELEREADFLLRQLNVPYVNYPPSPRYPGVEWLLRKGDKPGAIRVFQMDTGASLEDAPAAVETIQGAL